MSNNFALWSIQMEGFFAKQCDEMWLQQTAEAIEMLKAADERAAALVCNWMRNAAWQILDARRFACFEYVRLIDTANDIITDVADQLMPQLREHEPNPTSSGSSFKESQSNPLAGAKAFLGRLRLVTSTMFLPFPRAPIMRMIAVWNMVLKTFLAHLTFHRQRPIKELGNFGGEEHPKRRSPCTAYGRGSAFTKRPPPEAKQLKRAIRPERRCRQKVLSFSKFPLVGK